MVGSDDRNELLQDGLAIAVVILQSAQRNGKKVTPGNIAHYTILALGSGRRSTGYRKTDVLHPAAQLSGYARVQSMDEPVSAGEDGEEMLTLHDCLAAHVDDPATIAARRLDWETVLDSMDKIKKAILVALVDGTELTLLIRRLGRSRSSLQDQKRTLGRLIREHLGQDILVQVQARPGWRNTLDAVMERFACRAERRAA